ncbi:MAG: hypothetical protein HYX48_03345 [Chlamydiales bacterium]|nr:hypothetical protein [Chlamydiales bacterium]
MAKAKGKVSSSRSSASAASTRLGDYAISRFKFSGLDRAIKDLLSPAFKRASETQKNEKVNRLLLKLVQETPAPNFLLGAVLDYIDLINQEKVLEAYSFFNFELWLNQASGLSDEENYKVRARIAGKFLPRDEYQIYFPISSGKKHGGTHFVTAHSSPDLDTTVASFWGWVDAFAARVSEGLHVWNVPGGSPPLQIDVKLLFHQIFGENVFLHLAKGRSTLALSSLDLMTQKGVFKKEIKESSLTVDHERSQHAVILVDEKGYYLGDWRSMDVDGVRQVIMMLSQALRWFENNLHVQLISLFAKEKLSTKDFAPFLESVFQMTIGSTQPVKELTEKQRENLASYLVNVLKVKQGLKSTFEEFAHAMKAHSVFDFQQFIDLVESLKKSSLFDKQGRLIEDRPRIFNQLQKIIRGLDVAIQSIGSFVERLGIALEIKTEVFGHKPSTLSSRADLDEIRGKIGSYPYLTVTSTDKEGRVTPMGVVYASELLKPVLGTVTLRDFSNREETKVPSYLEVISIIDHHKSSINTSVPSVSHISDAQSSNTLVAGLAFKLNDAYGTGGMSLAQVEAQIKAVEKDLSLPKNKRIMRRLLQRHMAIENKSAHFVDPQRELIEYMHFFFAILDDTDLLTKVSFRDVECVASLLNRLKSLVLSKEVEIISFDDLPRDEKFAQKAAKRILQNEDAYSLYQKIYLGKEEAVEHNLMLCIGGLPSTIFLDTKTQNGCARVGQTKFFARNIPTYQKHADRIRASWYEQALEAYKEKKEIDLHIQMVSTLIGAEELFSGESEPKYKHQDELWIWIPSTELAIEHLKTFLNAFRALPAIAHNKMEVEFLGDNANELEKIFKESFLSIPKTRAKKPSLPIAVLKLTAGSINSRKAHISPCLPSLLA